MLTFQNGHHVVFTDASTKGNPGSSFVAWVLCNPEKKTVAYNSKSVGKMTNNQAEFLAIENALLYVKSKGISKLVVCSDNDGIISNIQGIVDSTDVRDRTRRNSVLRELEGFENIQFVAVDRKANGMAHQLARNALKNGACGLVEVDVSELL